MSLASGAKYSAGEAAHLGRLDSDSESMSNCHVASSLCVAGSAESFKVQVQVMWNFLTNQIRSCLRDDSESSPVLNFAEFLLSLASLHVDAKLSHPRQITNVPNHLITTKNLKVISCKFFHRYEI